MTTATYRGKLDEAFHDFLPWADPYLTSLVEKVRSKGRVLGEDGWQPNPRGDAAPPLNSDPCDPDLRSDDDRQRN